MMDLAIREWSLIPGPESNPPRDSLGLHGVVEYPPRRIADAFLAFPGMRLENGGDLTWWEWQALWEVDGRFIKVGMTLFETEPVLWGGSPLQGRCEPADVLRLWKAIRIRCPGVWMQNSDCEIHTPESFEKIGS